jgi:hypothetical protein
VIFHGVGYLHFSVVSLGSLRRSAPPPFSSARFFILSDLTGIAWDWLLKGVLLLREISGKRSAVRAIQTDQGMGFAAMGGT